VSVTDDLGTLLQQLHTSSTLQNAYRSNPAQAVQAFDLTAHERDAVVSKDLDDFVALGVVQTIWQLPAVMRGDATPTIRDRLLQLRLRIERVLHIRRPIGPDPAPPDLDRFRGSGPGN
jgi:hypothetical protein